MKLHKGDEVIVLAGKYRGERAKIERAIPADGLVILDTLNISKKHTKQVRQNMQAGIIDKFMPMDASNVALWCSGHKGPAKAGFVLEDGTKHRVCHRCGETL